MRAVAERLDATMAQVAIAWLLARPTVAAVLLGARTADQLASSLGAVELELDERDLRELTEVSDPGLPPYPHGMVEEWCGVQHWRDLGVGRDADR